MADEKKAKTKKPSGVTIERKGKDFIVKWKISDKDYGDGQDAQYKIGSDNWVAFNKVGTKTTKKSFPVDLDDYYPNKSGNDYKKKLTSVQVRIKGNRKEYTNSKNKKVDPEASAWSTKEFKILPPNNPKVTVSVGTWPSATFAWKVETDNTAHRWFRQIEYYDVLLVDSNKKPDDLTNDEWNGTASNALDPHHGTSTSVDSSRTITENSSSFEVGKSYTRYFRIRSQGLAGSQLTDKGEVEWVYGKHVYSDAQKATINNVKIERNDDVSGYTAQVNFTAPITRKNPIDKIITQYALAIPDEGMEPPDGLSWADGLVSLPRNTEEDLNSAIFTIDQLPALDQCLFVRVNTVYDDRTTYGTPMLVDYGRLKAPTNLSVSTDSQTHRATVTATNNSDVADSYLAVIFYSNDYPQGVEIGAISHGDTQTIIQCPEWGDSDNISFGVYAVVTKDRPMVKTNTVFVLTEDATISQNKHYYELKTYNYGLFSSQGYAYVTDKNLHTGESPAELGWYEVQTVHGEEYFVAEAVMLSDIVTSGGNVPLAPKNVTADKADNNGTIFVTWDWAWGEADRAEVSWSDHKDAWESTDEPQTYIVSKMRSSSLNIHGLETGIKWYVRVRLIAGMDDDSTYSPYSEIYPVELSSAPSIPALVLSDPIVTADGSTTASWGFVSTDGTGQLSAEVAEVNDNNSTTPIVKVGAQQYYELKISEIASRLTGWTVGTTHRIAVKVTSESGKESEDWSVPVALTIAEAPSCTLSCPSLVMQENEINPEVYEDELVTFETDFEQPVTKLATTLEPIQDLHGYDHPWVGGAGKNKLPCPYFTSDGTISGVTFTTQSDGSVKANGTATDLITFVLVSNSNLYANGNYILNGCPTGGSSSTYSIRAYLTGDSADDYGSGASIEVTDSVKINSIRILIRSGAVLNNVVFYPMIRLASVTDATFAPYSNICPIYGRTGQTVTVTGKNLLNLVSSQMESSGWNRLFPISLTAGTYIISCQNQFGASTKGAKVDLLDDGGNVVSTLISNYNFGDTVFVGTPTTIARETALKIKKIRFSCRAGGTSFDNIAAGLIQLELGSTATAYEPYTGTTYTRAFVDGQGNELTVYGGEDEIVGGVLTVTQKLIEYDGSSDENWGTETITALSGAKSMYILRPSDDKAYSATDITKMRCNTCPITIAVWNVGAMRATSYYNFVIADALGISTVADFRTYLASHPIQVVYELATPQTYQLTANEVETLIGTNYVWSDAGEVTVRTAEAVEQGYALKEMPITATVSGVGDAGMSTLIVERREAYQSERPNESDQVGFKGETVILASQGDNNGKFVIDNDSPYLLGRLDDEAQYTMLATVKDSLGQTAYSDPIDFIVDWTDQAIIPQATASIDDDWLIAILTPVAPAGARATDKCDIYRLSVDKPELIYRGATFGEQYVDPYPAIGQFGGHRFVMVTANGDYITEDQEFAWTDTGEGENDLLDTEFTIIDFGNGRVMLDRNVDFGWQWGKNFKETHYLGGKVEGDWLPDVSRSGSVNAVAITLIDQDTITSMRRLAVYSGECHVRTNDGSSFAANIDVQENYTHDTGKLVASFTLKVTRIEPQALEGMTYHDWRKIHNGEL